MGDLSNSEDQEVNKKREDILHFLSEKAPSLYEPYQAILKLCESEFPAQTYLICHLTRDIINRLPDIMYNTTSSRFDPNKYLNKISALWKKKSASSVFSDDAPISNLSDEPVCITKELFNEVDAMMNNFKENQEKIRPYEKLLFGNWRAERQEIIEPTLQKYKTLHRWFQEHAHLHNNETLPPTLDEVKSHFEELEDIFSGIIGNFFQNIVGIDDLLAKEEVDIERAIALLGSIEHNRYFFERLEDPNWIVPLDEKKYFNKEPSSFNQNDITYWPKWPASEYLARMALFEPTLVSQIFNRITTKNPNVILDFVRAANNSPDRDKKQIGSHIFKVMKNGCTIPFYYQEELFTLIESFLSNEHSSEFGLKLSKMYIRTIRKLADDIYGDSGDHFYLKAVKDLSIKMIYADTPSTLKFFVDEVYEQILKNKKLTNEDQFDDYSYSWRPAIEDHEQNSEYKFLSQLIPPIRDLFIEALKDSRIGIEKAFSILDDKEKLIFQRIKMHLVNIFAKEYPEIAKAEILNKGNYANPTVQHEYALLVGDHFDLLCTEETETFFQWIDETPDVPGFRNRFQEQEDRSPTEVEIERYANSTKYSKCQWIKKWLTGERKKHYELWKSEFDENQGAFFPIYRRTSWGHKPLLGNSELDQLEILPLLEKIELLLKNEKNDFFFNQEKVLSSFSRYIALHPERVVLDTDLLRNFSLSITQHYFQTINQQWEQVKSFPIDSSLELASWVISLNEDSGYTKDEINHCFEVLNPFVSKIISEEGTIRYKNKAYEIIYAILQRVEMRERDKLLEDSQQIVEEHFDDWMFYNPLGSALFLLFEYSRWVICNITEDRGNEKLSLWEHIEEVKDFIEAFLQSENIHSFSVRAVFGYFFSHLFRIDSKWLERIIESLFDLESIKDDFSSAYSWGAWNAFLLSSSPYNGYFELLEKQFWFALECYKELQIDEIDDNHPIARFSQHIIILYGRGQLTLKENSILSVLLKSVDISIRSHAISFVGRTLEESHNRNEEVPDEVIERFKSLWHWYWYNIGSKDDIPDSTLFSYWYTCKLFDAEWAINNLYEYSRNVNEIDYNYKIPNQLSIDSKDYPKMCIDIMEKLIHTDREGWNLSSWRGSIYVILSNAIVNSDSTKQKAEALIDVLGRKGFLEYGELLD